MSSLFLSSVHLCPSLICRDSEPVRVRGLVHLEVGDQGLELLGRKKKRGFGFFVFGFVFGFVLCIFVRTFERLKRARKSALFRSSFPFLLFTSLSRFSHSSLASRGPARTCCFWFGFEMVGEVFFLVFVRVKVEKKERHSLRSLFLDQRALSPPSLPPQFLAP